MPAPAKYDILSEIEVPDRFRERWQRTLGTLAALSQVKAALVMRVHARQIEVFARNGGEEHVYEEREMAPLDSGLYCETVMTERTELLVANALADPLWEHNPDVRLGMISYLGLPLEWPTGHIFGTICVLDDQPHEYSTLQRETLQQFRDLVQDELALLFENHLLKQEAAEREEAERQLLEAQQQLQRLARRQQVGRERERAMLARGLHDEIIQNLTAAKMDLDSTLRRLPEDMRSVVRPAVSVIDARLMDTVHRLREMCDDLVPAVLEDLGLAAAIEWTLAEFQRRTGIHCIARTREERLSLSPEAQGVLFRTLQQLLSHIMPEQPGVQLTVELLQRRRVVVLRILADGHPPFADAPCARGHATLAGLEAQIMSWGGRLRMWRTPEGVACLEVTLPTHGSDQDT
jgi:signal transduction histidine kinase